MTESPGDAGGRTMYLVRSVVGCVIAVAVCAGAEAQLGINPGPTVDWRKKSQVVEAPPIQWVDSFEEAQADSKRLGRPIFVFFHDSLKGARLLEVGTVHTPDVQRRAVRFVCVQVDPQKETELVKKLGIKMTQGVMFTDADCKVLGRLEGNPTPEAIAGGMDIAIRKFGPVPSNADLEALDKMLARAKTYRKGRRVADALKLCKRMAKTGAKCEQILQAKELIAEIEAEGAKDLAKAEQLVKSGKSVDAKTALRRLVNAYRGSDVGAKARDLLAKMQSKGAGASKAAALAKKVGFLWRTAKSAKNRGRLDEETDALKKIVAVATGADEQKAAARLADIEGDPELTAKRDWQRQERAAMALLARGKMWLRTTPDRGKKILQELVEKYPETTQAEEARELLESAD